MPSLRLLFRSRPGVSIDPTALCASVQTVLDANGVGVTVGPGSVGHLNLAGMSAVAVGSCAQVFNGTDHMALFKAIAPMVASHGDAVVFVVGSITDGGAASGCAAHPANCAGLVMTEAAAVAASGGSSASGRWVLAHEIGHLLGLQHGGTTSSLMFDPPTAITADIPELSDDEKAIVLGAALLSPAVSAEVAVPASALVKKKNRKQKRTKKATKKTKNTKRSK